MLSRKVYLGKALRRGKSASVAALGQATQVLLTVIAADAGTASDALVGPH
jgi:hypothetical protein